MNRLEAHRALSKGHAVYLETSGPTIYWEMDLPTPNKLRAFFSLPEGKLPLKDHNLPDTGEFTILTKET